MELEKYFDRIRPHVKGCPDAVIKQYLRVVLRDVCYRANVWFHESTVYFVNGLSEYALNTPDKTQVATVQAVVRPDGTRLESRDSFPPFLTAGTPQYFRHFERGVMTVAPVPVKSTLHTVELTLMPTLDADEVPDTVYGITVEFAPWGVLAQLQLMEKEDWFDPQQAEYNRQRYEKYLYRKRIKGLVGVSAADQTVTNRRFV